MKTTLADCQALSGLFVMFNRDGSLVEPAILSAAMQRLEHRGWDGANSLILGEIALGHQHAWVVPEEIGEQQPLSDASGRYLVMLDGRIDNRDDLLNFCGLHSAEYHPQSDAQVVLQAYIVLGEACFTRLIGSYVIVLVDTVERCVILARDAIGERTLYYYTDESLLVAASEPYAVLAHPAIPKDLNQTRILRWYAVQPPDFGMTFYAAVKEMCPAQFLRIQRHKVIKQRTWEPHVETLHYRSNEEYAQHFRMLLDLSVRARMRTAQPPCVQMSGGYDSTSVAAMAARQNRTPLRTISWVFDELPEANEYRYIEAMQRHSNLQGCTIRGDESWPFRHIGEVPLGANYPLRNCYHRLALQVYQAAQAAGSRVVLTGEGGDHVFAGYKLWLIHRLRDDGVLALNAVWRYIKRYGVGRFLRDRGVRGLARQLASRLSGIQQVPWRSKESSPHWLIAEVVQSLSALGWTDIHHEVDVPRPDQLRSILSPWWSEGFSDTGYLGKQVQIQLEHPYRDRRLVEFMLSLPTQQLFDGENAKTILYHSMQDVLPEVVRQRRWRSSLQSLYFRGIERGKETLETVLYHSDALWPRYVKKESLRQLIEGPQHKSQKEQILLWFCYSMELWRAQPLN